MRTALHQEAFPGEDISDRPPPERERARPAGADRGRARRAAATARAELGGQRHERARGLPAGGRRTSRPRRAAKAGDDVALLVADRGRRRARPRRASASWPRPAARRPARRQHLGDAAGRLSARRSASGRCELRLSTPVADGALGRRAARRATGRRFARRRSAPSGPTRRRAAPRCSPRSRGASGSSVARLDARTSRSRTTSAVTAGRSATATSQPNGRSTPTRPCSPASRAAPRCRAQAGRSRRRSSPSSSPAASSSRRSRCTPGVSSPEGGEPPVPRALRRARADGAPRERRAAWGGRVIAVGTTVVRALETVAAAGRNGVGRARAGPSLIVTPERRAPRGRRPPDRAGTSPSSSHLQLLEAVAGRDLLERSYRAARERGYRWHEFGDLHLILAERPGSAVEARPGSGR